MNQQQQQQQFERLNTKTPYGSNCQTVDECETDLKASYNVPGHPIAFSGIQNIYDYYNGKLNREKIQEFLASSENYTLHREFHKQQRNPSYSHFKRYQFQLDVVDVQELAPFNDNVRYILTAIDTFTRFAFARLLKDKKGLTVLQAFQSILHEAGQKPNMIVIDRGTEFYNKPFLNFCKQNNIEVFSPDSAIHAAYIERFNRSFQSLIYKFMTENETNRFIDKVDKDGVLVNIFKNLLSTYNNRKHRMIGVTPFVAENNPNVHLDMRLKMSKYYETIKPKGKKFSIGDLVRVAKIKGKFARSYQEQSNAELFRIHDIKSNKKIVMYVLSNYNGDEIIKGNFYGFELSKVNSDIFRINRVIRTRRNNNILQHFVNWKGFPDSYNSWVNADDITQEF
jgi:transposase InsO family protein